MSTWQPDLSGRTGPRYRAIAEALFDDIASGSLLPGSRLPPQRDLARALGVTVGTVSRAYLEAERRGLVQGEIGRGTFVRGEATEPAASFLRATGDLETVDLTQSVPATVRRTEERRLLQRGLQGLSRSAHLEAVSSCPPPAGAMQHRQIAARFLSRLGTEIAPERVVITCGAQHAMAAVFATLTRPGDAVLAESLTFPGMKGLANLLSLRLVGVPMDDDGMIPEELERACRQSEAKVLYTIPTLQNPTSSLMPAKRRQAIAGIAERHGVAVVEDEVYGHLPDERPSPITSHLPGSGYLVGSVSKIIAPGLRVGFAVVPEDATERVAAAIWSTSSMAPQPMVELVASWLDGGEIDRFLSWRRDEARLRFARFRRILGERHHRAHPFSYHAWLELPEPWRAGEFVARMRRRGVAVTPADAFVADRSPAPEAVRVSMLPVADLGRLDSALVALGETLDEPGEPGHRVV